MGVAAQTDLADQVITVVLRHSDIADQYAWGANSSSFAKRIVGGNRSGYIGTGLLKYPGHYLTSIGIVIDNQDPNPL